MEQIYWWGGWTASGRGNDLSIPPAKVYHQLSNRVGYNLVFSMGSGSHTSSSIRKHAQGARSAERGAVVVETRVARGALLPLSRRRQLHCFGKIFPTDLRLYPFVHELSLKEREKICEVKIRNILLSYSQD